MADFYDPTSDIATGWASTGASHYTEIDDGIRNPSEPTLTDYVSTNSNNAVDEWGFPAVTGSPVEIVAWLYAETQSKSTIIVSFQQSGVERATITIPVSSAKKWYQVKWMNPTGDFSTLTIEVKQVKQGTGAGTYAYVYAAYLRAGPNLDKQVGASGDDGHSYWGGFYPSSTQVSHGIDGEDQEWDGFHRWTGVTYSGTVNVSYMQCFEADSDGSPELNIYGVEEADPAAPTTYAEYYADPLTTAVVPWDGLWNAGAWNQSPSLNPILVELGDRSDKAVMVQVKNDHAAVGADHFNMARSWDYAGNLHGAKLHIEFTAGGVTVELQGTSDGAATAVGNVIRTLVLVGASDGLAATDSFLRRLRPLVGASDGISNVADAMLRKTIPFQAASDGAASVSGQLLKDIYFIGASDGVAGVDGVLKGIWALKGTSDGVSTVLGQLLKDIYLQGGSDGVATADGALTGLWLLHGVSDGIAGVSGQLLKDIYLAASSDGLATVDGNLIRTLVLAGTSDGIASVVGDLTIGGLILLIGTSDGMATVTGTLPVLRTLVGSSDGVATVDGTLPILRALVGSSDGAATVDGQILRDVYFLASSSGVASVSGQIIKDVYFLASSSGAASVLGNLIRTLALMGTSDGVATVAGALRIGDILALMIFLANTRTFDRAADARIFDRVALTKEYDFEAEERDA